MWILSNMRIALLLLSIVSTATLFGQGFDRTLASIGIIEKGSPRHADFVYTHNGDKKTFILRVEHARNISYLLSSREALPDSSITLRIQYNPSEKGDFKERILVYLAHDPEPVELMVSGTTDENLIIRDLACPSFNDDAQPGTTYTYELEVLDSLTNEPIRDAFVRVVYAGEIRYKGRTDKEGLLKAELPPGYIYADARKETYQPGDFAGYVNHHNPRATILLYQPEQETAEPVDTSTILLTEEPEPVPEITEVVRDTGDFSLEVYRPNNVVFLLDISYSMGRRGRFEMLKAGMMELIDMIRPQDKVTFVTYANHAEVLFPATSGDNKEALKQQVIDLKAGGNTAGGDGIKLAFEQAKDNYIEGGNNVVIIVTDGVFNTGETRYMRFVRKNARKGIYMSAIALRTSVQAKTSLGEVAENGQGRLVVIETLDEAILKVKGEIRNGSFIPPEER